MLSDKELKSLRKSINKKAKDNFLVTLDREYFEKAEIYDKLLNEYNGYDIAKHNDDQKLSQNDDVYLLVGEKRVGKSTVGCYLAGQHLTRNLEEKTNTNIIELRRDDNNNYYEEPVCDISHQTKGKTMFSKIITTRYINLIDTPGFHDNNEDDKQVIAAFGFNKVFGTLSANVVCVCFVLNYQTLFEKDQSGLLFETLKVFTGGEDPIAEKYKFVFLLNKCYDSEKNQRVLSKEEVEEKLTLYIVKTNEAYQNGKIGKRLMEERIALYSLIYDYFLVVDPLDGGYENFIEKLNTVKKKKRGNIITSGFNKIKGVGSTFLSYWNTKKENQSNKNELNPNFVNIDPKIMVYPFRKTQNSEKEGPNITKGKIIKCIKSNINDFYKYVANATNNFDGYISMILMAEKAAENTKTAKEPEVAQKEGQLMFLKKKFERINNSIETQEELLNEVEGKILDDIKKHNKSHLISWSETSTGQKVTRLKYSREGTRWKSFFTAGQGTHYFSEEVFDVGSKYDKAIHVDDGTSKPIDVDISEKDEGKFHLQKWALKDGRRTGSISYEFKIRYIDCVEHKEYYDKLIERYGSIARKKDNPYLEEEKDENHNDKKVKEDKKGKKIIMSKLDQLDKEFQEIANEIDTCAKEPVENLAKQLEKRQQYIEKQNLTILKQTIERDFSLTYFAHVCNMWLRGLIRVINFLCYAYGCNSDDDKTIVKVHQILQNIDSEFRKFRKLHNSPKYGTVDIATFDAIKSKYFDPALCKMNSIIR